MLSVTVIRPYGSHIRQRVFALLEGVGCAVRESDVIPKGTSDDAVIKFLRQRPPAVLLVPLHAHRGADGNDLNGIALVERIAVEVPDMQRVPILMPVSTVALAGARLRLAPHSARALREGLRSRILLLDEDTLERPETIEAVRRHLVA